MSASHFPVLRVTALQAAAALAQYERHVRRLASAWLDMDLYEQVSREIDEIKLFCAALPDVHRPWADLLISHTEMVRALWEGGRSDTPSSRDETQRRLDDHLACIDTLARRCLRVADRSGSELP